MKYKDTLDKFKEMRRLTLEIENIKDVINELDHKIEGVNSISYDGMPKGGNKPSYIKETLIDKKATYKIKLDERNTDLYLLQLPFNLLKSEEKEMINLCYIQDLSREKVCTKLNIKKAAYYKIRNHAVEEFDRIAKLINEESE